jgi:hypothetical protein
MSECFTVPTAKPAPTAAFIRRALLDAVDYGLLATGQIVRAVIYQRIEEQYHVKREEIPDKLDAFYAGLQEMLGGSAELIKRLITKNLYSRLDLKFTEQKNWTLVDYVHHAKKARDVVHLTS